MSDQRSAALSAASAPGVSAAAIASCSAAPLAYASISFASQSVAALVRRRWALLIQATRPTTAATAMASQNQSHGDTELLLAGEGVLVVPGVTDGWAGATSDEVLVALALLAALEAGLWLGLAGAVVAAEEVAAGDDAGVAARVAVTLAAMLL